MCCIYCCDIFLFQLSAANISSAKQQPEGMIVLRKTSKKEMELTGINLFNIHTYESEMNDSERCILNCR
uniref:Secreted protein n=1 Tax=Ascaris lumbricoides TaxID=6252 RepID=A0A0M3ILX8_ASCLU